VRLSLIEATVLEAVAAHNTRTEILAAGAKAGFTAVDCVRALDYVARNKMILMRRVTPNRYQFEILPLGEQRLREHAARPSLKFIIH
jgi:hypothetical protein